MAYFIFKSEKILPFIIVIFLISILSDTQNILHWVEF